MLLNNSHFMHILQVPSLIKNKRFRLFSSQNSRKIIFKNLHKTQGLTKDLTTQYYVLKYFYKSFKSNFNIYRKHIKARTRFVYTPINIDVSHRVFNQFFKTLLVKKKHISFFSNPNRLQYIKTIQKSIPCFISTKKFTNKILTLHNVSKNIRISMKNRLYPLKRYFTPTKKILYSQTQNIIISFLYVRLVNIFIKSGLKQKIETLVQKIFFQLKDYFFESKFMLGNTHHFVFLTFIMYIPKLAVKGVRKGSVVYKVPFLITPFQQFSIFFKWFKDSVSGRNETSYKVRLFKEFFDLLDENNLSETLKKRSSLNKAVINGRSFSHYRWV